MRKLKKWVLVWILLVGALFMGTYFYSANSEAYHFASEWVRQSDSVRSVVGEVRKVRLRPWADYRQHYDGDSTRATLTLDIQGTKASARVRLEVRKVDSQWSTVHSGFVE